MNMIPFLDDKQKLAYSQFLLADLLTDIKVHRIATGDRTALKKNLEAITDLAKTKKSSF